MTSIELKPNRITRHDNMTQTKPITPLVLMSPISFFDFVRLCLFHLISRPYYLLQNISGHIISFAFRLSQNILHSIMKFFYENYIFESTY